MRPSFVNFPIKSCWYYFRANVALGLAVAAATAVLVGALIVGSSMRGSLRHLALDRLAGIDEIIYADHMFSEALLDQVRESEVFKANYRQAEPAIFFPNGVVENRLSDKFFQAMDVNVLAVQPTFWNFQTQPLPEPMGSQIPADEAFAIINRTLADNLGIDDSDVAKQTAKITIRIPKPSLLPNDSALGKKRDLAVSLVDVPISKIIENRELGRFSLQLSQQSPSNAFVPLQVLQGLLNRETSIAPESPPQINAICLAGSVPHQPPDHKTTKRMIMSLAPSSFDLGLSLKPVRLEYRENEVAKVSREYLSLTSRRLVFSKAQAQLVGQLAERAQPAFTYLVNKIEIKNAPESKIVPYSMLTAIDPNDSFRPISAISGQPIHSIGDNEVILNQWTADDLGAKIGDQVLIDYFEPESTHGQQVDLTAQLRVADIAQLATPAKPYVIRRRQQMDPAVFLGPPTDANDPNLTPEVPGFSDSASIENWDLPFKTVYKIRDEDDDYWNYHRTTPKGFVNLATGQRLWGSRFGEVTNFRLPPNQSIEEFNKKLAEAWRSDPAAFGLDVLPIKQKSLKASGGSTPFDVLFLGLSLFIIGSALLLVLILFRLALEQRVDQIGLLSALGFCHSRITRVWLVETGIVCGMGCALGVILGLSYAAILVVALRTLWVGAIATPFVELHIDRESLVIGFSVGFMMSLLTVYWNLRRSIRIPTRQLLAGKLNLESETQSGNRGGRIGLIVGMVALVGGVFLLMFATRLGGEAQAGAFMGGGFLILAGLFMGANRALNRESRRMALAFRNLAQLSFANAQRNPLRSAMLMGMVAIATFLIVSISSFRLHPTDRSTGGAQWFAQSSVPLIADLGTPQGQMDLLGIEQRWPLGLQVDSFRLKPGEDASCNNLYQTTQPIVLGVPSSWINRFDDTQTKAMMWAGTQSTTEKDLNNPWQLLNDESEAIGTEADPIPAVLDKNTAMYSLKIFTVGTNFSVSFDTGEHLTFRIVGFLENSLFQGKLLIGESNFKKAFPNLSGSRIFLFTSSHPDRDRDVIDSLESRLTDYGFDVQPSQRLVEQFASVQNTYLSAFQALGGLGLLLGTFGLAAIQLRTIIERRKELALMQAVGFRRNRLLKLLFLEQLVLLLGGLSMGTVAALAATIPHWLMGDASMPWGQTGIILAVVVIVGTVAARWSASQVLDLPLPETLKS